MLTIIILPLVVLVRKVNKVRRARKVQPDRRDRKVQQVNKVQPDRRDRRDGRDQRAKKGDKGHAGISGTGGLSDTGFTTKGNITMANNRILGLVNPILDKEPVTLNYADTNYLKRFANNHIGLHKIEAKLPIADWIWGYANLDSTLSYPDAQGGTWWPPSVRTDEINTKTTINLNHITFDNELATSQILASTVTVKIMAYMKTSSEEHQLFVLPMTGRTLISSKNSTDTGDIDNHTAIINSSYFLGTLFGSKNIQAYTVRMKITGTTSGLTQPEVIACFKLYESR